VRSNMKFSLVVVEELSSKSINKQGGCQIERAYAIAHSEYLCSSRSVTAHPTMISHSQAI
jgi:hypothetical protein